MHRTICALSLLLLPVFAQDQRPNFSGTWRYVPSISAREVDRIDHKEPDFSISETVGRADVIYSHLFKTDGRYLCEDTAVSRVAHWRDKTLILETTWTQNGSVTTKREELFLSDDGKSLTKSVHFTGPKAKSDETIELTKISDGITGIKLGDTPAVVRHEWGDPLAVEQHGNQTVFVYKDGLEVIFVDGKMTDSFHRRP